MLAFNSPSEDLLILNSKNGSNIREINSLSVCLTEGQGCFSVFIESKHVFHHLLQRLSFGVLSEKHSHLFVWSVSWIHYYDASIARPCILSHRTNGFPPPLIVQLIVGHIFMFLKFCGDVEVLVPPLIVCPTKLNLVALICLPKNLDIVHHKSVQSYKVTSCLRTTKTIPLFENELHSCSVGKEKHDLPKSQSTYTLRCVNACALHPTAQSF
jgi:hypothetical protein